MRVLVCGSRAWRSYLPIARALQLIYQDVEPGEELVLIHGAAPGADSIAAECAASLGFTLLPFPADWVRYQKSAGPIRNARMLKVGKPDRVLAFTLDISQSPGTRQMVALARRAGIPVEIITG